MNRPRQRRLASCALALCLSAPWAVAQTRTQTPMQTPMQTVCTITVNSSDEKETFRRHLPSAKYQFVELVERGRPDRDAHHADDESRR
jgi:hypothetical protein